MENYNQMGATPGRGNFVQYPSTSSSSSMVTLLTPNNSSMHHNNNNQEMSSMGMILGSLISPARFQTCPLSVNTSVHVASNQVQERNPNNNDLGSSSNNNSSTTTSNTSNEVEAMKSKIMNHPQFSNLLHSYIQCQKVGAPPEVAERLSAVWQEFENKQRSSVAPKESPKDPELDQFMEAYNDMLVKYKVEITRPVQEAMEFMRRIESQLNVLTNGLLHVVPNDERSEGIGSSDEDQEMNSGGETEAPQNQIDPRAEDAELKKHLLKKYSGYLGSLKQELSKKKKVRKLPKEARQKLLTWWELHYKWPYPSESEKAALAEATGLDQKQINNWFINQRKRHWKPSEDMQFMVMEGLHHPHNPPALYMEGHYMGDGPYRFPT